MLSRQGTTCTDETAHLRIAGEFDSQLLEHIVDGEIDLFQVDDPGLKLADVEERVQHDRYRARRRVQPGDQLQGFFAFLIRDALRQTFPNRTESL